MKQMSRRGFIYLSVVSMAGAAGYLVSCGRETALSGQTPVEAPKTAMGTVATPAATTPPIPDAPSLARRITPNEDFFIPNPERTAALSLGDWSLQLSGAVERPLTINWAELLQLPAVTEERTLECLGNSSDGKQIANAVWTGVPLAVLLEKTGVRPGIKKVVYRCADEYTTAVTGAAVTDWDALLAYRMNGEPLPQGHGYPVRMLVHNLYGWKSPKWITGIEFVAEEDWKAESELEPFSMIEEPAAGNTTGPYLWLKGIAFAGMSGIERVEISTDSGKTWGQAELAPGRIPGAWTPWRYLWKIPGPGRCVLAARAYDGAGRMELVDGAIHAVSGSELHTRQMEVR